MVTVLPSPAEGLERDAMVYATITFARMVKKLPRNGNIDTDSLWGAALLGAAKSLERFDPARGVKFSSYAIRVIECEMLEEMRQQDWLTYSQRQRARAEEEETGEFPLWAQRPPSLDSTSLTAEESEYGDEFFYRDLPTATDDTEAEALVRIEAEIVRRLVDRLPKRERHAIRRYHYDGVLCMEIAAELGLSTQRVYQILTEARGRLGEWAIEEGLVE